MSAAPVPANDATLAAAAFADAMSTLASGVVLVTCRVGGRPWGTTVTAFASVSADPPTVLASLGSGTAGARAIAGAGAFGVSVLSRDQRAVAEHGAASGAAKFLDALAEPRPRAGATPAVAGALAHLDCDVVEALAVADHTVFFGRVRAVRRGRGSEPLVYHRRGYRALAAPEPQTERSLRCISS